MNSQTELHRQYYQERPQHAYHHRVLVIPAGIRHVLRKYPHVRPDKHCAVEAVRIAKHSRYTDKRADNQQDTRPKHWR